MDLVKYERDRAYKKVVELFFRLRKEKRKTASLKELIQLAKRIKHPPTYHYYGEDFPFSEIDDIAWQIGTFCSKWGRIQIRQTKEKFGSVRVYCSMGLTSIYQLIYPCQIYLKYPALFIRDWDYCLTNSVLRFFWFHHLFFKYQCFIYRIAYKRAIRKYPHLKSEILQNADYAELLIGL